MWQVELMAPYHESEMRNMKRRLYGLTNVALLIVLVPGQSIDAQVNTDSTADSPDRKVEIRVNGRAVKEVAIQPGEVSVDAVRHTVRPGDRLKALMRAHGIVPDGGAIALFYELNPTIRDADALQVGSAIILPTLTTLDTLVEANRGRVSYAVLFDTTYKSQLTATTNRITQLTDSLRRITGSSLEMRAIDANADKMASAVQALRRSSIPLSEANAAELSAALDTYELGIDHAVTSAQPAQAQLSQSGTHVAAVVAAMAKASRAGTNSTVEVPVDVIDTDGQNLGNVRIIYARPMFENSAPRRDSFIKRERTRVMHLIAVGGWKMWVEDLAGIEISVRREQVTVTNPSRPVVLVVKSGR